MYQAQVNRVFCRALGIVALGIGVLVGMALHSANAAECPAPQSQPIVEIIRLPPTVEFDHTVAKKRVARYFINGGGKTRPSSLGAGAHTAPQTVGLTNAHFSVQSAYTTEAAHIADGSWCMSVKKVTLTIGYSSQKVYIPSEYAVGSCEYQAVYDHEMQHVNTNQDTLAAHLDRIERSAKLAMAAIGTIKVRQKGALQTEAKRQVNRALDGLFSDFEADRQARNAELDREENYRAISGLCSNW
jgi:hypothetical protein